MMSRRRYVASGCCTWSQSIGLNFRVCLGTNRAQGSPRCARDLLPRGVGALALQDIAFENLCFERLTDLRRIDPDLW